MGVRILYDREQRLAAMYCSTSGFAFGPTFDDGGKEVGYADGRERMEAFFKWYDTKESRDPRRLTDAELEALYGEWLAYEVEAYKESAP